MMTQSYLLIDPQHEYAIALIEAVYQRYKIKPICLYPSRLQEIYRRKHFPLLRSSLVEASYYMDTATLPQLVRSLRKRHDIIGVMPYYEQSLEIAADLMSRLEISWNDPQVLRRCRDKHAFKEYLRHHHPEIPVTESRLVQRAEDVYTLPLPERFVIKPNQGGGNRDVAFFKADTPRDVVASYFVRKRGAHILEEYLAGREYAVNGQMDHRGFATVINIVEYERVAVNGKPNVYHRTHHVPRTDAAFAVLHDYAVRIMEASSLRRCPFHLEAMLTVHGPRLIEVGARFGGTRYAYAANSVHGGNFDIFTMAGHYYLFDAPCADPGFDWEHYNRICFLHLDGIALRNERIYRMDGVREVEEMPEFVRWVIKPQVGQRLQRTVDLYSVPYALQLRGYGSRDDLIEASEHAKRLLQVNQRVSHWRKAAVSTREQLRHLKLRGHFWLSRALGT